MTTRLSSRGQVVIPAEIRQQMNWGEGLDLEIEMINNQVVLRPLAPTDFDWRTLRGAFRDSMTATEMLATARQEELDAEDAKHTSL
ncbi:MAG: AbrB/MazE/SpoVT family DNA-binding domain-containing protein [Acidobacteria bacterium]|nr:AbrB/MazE/SpoVT family DNA-binding domain-containing protein [Acidobacteriota bacterium]